MIERWMSDKPTSATLLMQHKMGENHSVWNITCFCVQCSTLPIEKLFAVLLWYHNYFHDSYGMDIAYAHTEIFRSRKTNGKRQQQTNAKWNDIIQCSMFSFFFFAGDFPSSTPLILHCQHTDWCGINYYLRRDTIKSIEHSFSIWIIAARKCMPDTILLSLLSAPAYAENATGSE